MSTYGITNYGQDVYGLSLPPAYILPTFTAQSVNYGTIQVAWSKPSGGIYDYRLLTNRYGFPVNETDGTIVIDSSSYPGSVYNDTAVIPGTYHYYGMYVLVDVADDIWIRSGITGCLSNYDFASSQLLWDKLPTYFTQLPNGGELTGDASGNSYLQQFINILGWGFDYLQTQYTTLAQHLNDPSEIPVNDLVNLAAEVGLFYYPGTPAYTMRKGVANAAHVARERGTTLGLANEITVMTGWGADVQTGPNLLLDTDQSAFLSPVFEPWTASRSYAIGECVWTGPATTSKVWSGAGYWYQCLVATQGQAPPANGTSSTYWQCLNNTADFVQAETNPATGNPSTWEALNSATPGSTVPAGTLAQTLGILNLTGAGYAWNGLTLKNTATTAQTYLLRSVSRSTSDLSTLPDPGFESGYTVIPTTGRPVPTWVPTSWPKIMAVVKADGTGTYPGQSGESGGKYLDSAWWTGTNCWITREKGNAHSGTWSGLITPQSTGQVTGGSPWITVQPGQAVSASAWFRPSAAVEADVSIVWVNSHGAQTGTPVTGTGTNLTAATWTQLSTSGTAPTGAVYAYLMPVLFTPVQTQVDDIGFAVTTTSLAYSPDQLNVINNAIPVPWVRESETWNPAVRYGTGSLVLYLGLPFVALRASTGAVPPLNNAATPEWAPLSENQRIRLGVSGYLSQNTTVSSNQQVAVTPFAEWYDQHGNFISRVLARTSASNGITGKPNNLAFDSFTSASRVSATGAGANVALGPWQATFWATTSTPLTGTPALTRTDPAVDFTWPAGAGLVQGQPDPRVGNAHWSASWITNFTPPANGEYTFKVSGAGGGGLRVIVGGQTVINEWTSIPSGTLTATIPLQGASPVEIEVDYWVPSTGGGSYGSNLLPAWAPTSTAVNHNNTQPLPVISLYAFKLAVACPGAQLHCNITWYTGSTPVGTLGLQEGPDGTLVVEGNVPDGVNYASVYISTNYDYKNYTQSFEMQMANPAPSPPALDMTSPVSYVSAAGLTSTATLTGRVTDDDQSTWETPAGNFSVLAGQAWPVPGTNAAPIRSYALLAGEANTQVGVTLSTFPSQNLSQGIIFRFVNDSSYWRADQTTLAYVNGISGAGHPQWTLVATHSTAFQPGDRMTVELNGTSISVYRNGTEVSSATNTFNETAVLHGMVANDVLVT